MTENQIKDLIKLKEEEIRNLRNDLAGVKIEQSPYKKGDVFMHKDGYLKTIISMGLSNQDKLIYFLADIIPNHNKLQTIDIGHIMEYFISNLDVFTKIGTAKLSEDGSHIISLNINYQNNKQ